MNKVIWCTLNFGHLINEWCHHLLWRCHRCSRSWPAVEKVRLHCSAALEVTGQNHLLFQQHAPSPLFTYHGKTAGPITSPEDNGDLGGGACCYGSHHLCPGLGRCSIRSRLTEVEGVRGRVYKEQHGNSPQRAEPDKMRSLSCWISSQLTRIGQNTHQMTFDPSKPSDEWRSVCCLELMETTTIQQMG